jgi:hypothetical protein
MSGCVASLRYKSAVKMGAGASSGTEEQFSRMKGKMAGSLLLFKGFFSEKG